MFDSDRSGNTILFLSTYPPRMCGIATFTKDITDAFNNKFNPQLFAKVIALNEDKTSAYAYNQNVDTVIVASDVDEYVRLAKRINRQKKVALVMVEHEFGIYGGRYGDYLLPFLQVLNKPVITAFHTVLEKPDWGMRRVVQTIADQSVALVIMNELSRQVLEQVYGVEKDKIVVIPHGIPQTALEKPELAKKYMRRLKGHKVLMTFGLLSPNKGVEYTIRALPAVVKKYPDVIFVLVGETHPGVLSSQGEEYRNFLKKEVQRLKLNQHVLFYDQYYTLDELIVFLKACDIYIASSLDPKQSVSGTISYALGVGRPVIATNTLYSKYIIDGTNGSLVPIKSATAVSQAVLMLLDDNKLRWDMSVAAYKKSRPMAWPNVVQAHFLLYKKFIGFSLDRYPLPELSLRHMKNLTDNFGIIQFANFTTPDKKSGYSTDDNARALLVSAQAHLRLPSDDLVESMKLYLNFLKFVQRPDGSFANMVTIDRKVDTTRTDDVQGRAVWATGYVSSLENVSPQIRLQSERIFIKAIERFDLIKSPRALAFAIIGVVHYLQKNKNEKVRQRCMVMADELVSLYTAVSTPEWQWFESSLTYSNSVMPEALFFAYMTSGDKKYLQLAEKTLLFLTGINFRKDYYEPIGQRGWFVYNEERSLFDQQPEDAAIMVLAQMTAYRVTGDKNYKRYADRAFEWFLGFNHLDQMVYDESSGGCYDGLGEHSLNFNQGSESTVMYLLARLALD